MKRYLPVILILAFLLSGCGAMASNQETSNEYERGIGMGMGPAGMMDRHHAPIPAEFAQLKAPGSTEDMLVRGREIYELSCAECHGENGMGDGSIAPTLDPTPAPVAHTAQMMSDAYLFWRISEGGTQFNSSMPAWKDSLTGDEIWSVVAYVRALGRGEAAEIQAMQHEMMIARAIELGLITREEADTFELVHDALDAYRSEHAAELPPGDMDEHQEAMLDALVQSGMIDRSQAGDFARVHQLLLDEGLMH